MKYDQGLSQTAGKWIRKTKSITRSREIVDFCLGGTSPKRPKSKKIMRDKKNLLPLKKDQKILVIEQRIPYEFVGKRSVHAHHMFCEQMVRNSENVILADVGFSAFEDEIKDASALAKEADLVVMTNYYAASSRPQQPAAGQETQGRGHDVVVVTKIPTWLARRKRPTPWSAISAARRIPSGVGGPAFGKFKPSPSTRVPVRIGVQKAAPAKR